MSTFKLHAPFSPTPPQKEAAKKLLEGLKNSERFQTLLGVTGSGKTYTMAQIIARSNRPALIISHNKTLAAQLYQEFKEFFPDNAVHYFVSYYDYYQPEAYLPASDTYIEKDAKINEELDHLRHAATQDLLLRNDVIIVASVSCIYNIGDPDAYKKVSLDITQGQKISQKDFLRNIVALGYIRNDIDFHPGTFRVRGDRVEIFIITGQEVLAIEFTQNTIESLTRRPPEIPFRLPSMLNQPNGISPKTSAFIPDTKYSIQDTTLFPAHFWVTPENQLKIAMENIRFELQGELQKLKNAGKDLEAQRLEKRVTYDLTMMKETGYCHGIENYSGHLEFRKRGEAPFTLIDYYPKNFLTFIDESHMSVPQLRGMIAGDRARKQTLIEYGFRLPSAIDNRPLEYDEFLKKVGQIIFTSATPAPYEKSVSKNIAELLVRPTGLLEPTIEIRKIEGQLTDAVGEIKKRVEKNGRVLVTTLTKRLAEDLSEFLTNEGIKTQYLHSEVKTLERPSILASLRKGEFDVVVGVNLLREGLDLPEVSLIIIFDADKEGFLRSETTFLQIMGRAARHENGSVIMYADATTGSMERAVKEVNRRRNIQKEYNLLHLITPKAITKEIRPWAFGKKTVERIEPSSEYEEFKEIAKSMDIKDLKKEMRAAAQNLDFERAAELRDLIKKLSGAGQK